MKSSEPPSERSVFIVGGQAVGLHEQRDERFEENK